MIRLNLQKLLNNLANRTGSTGGQGSVRRTIPLKEVAEQSGCDKNALSRIVNQPTRVPSAAVIDKLIQYFFRSFRDAETKRKGPEWMKGWRERRLMERIISDFITIYPDPVYDEYWSKIPPEIKDDPDSTTLDAIWSMHEQLEGPRSNKSFKNTDSIEVIESLGIKLKAARELLEPDGVRLQLTQNEFNLLFNEFPSLTERLGLSLPELTTRSSTAKKKK